ncbi:hypothetical protein ACIBG8_44365 [Nonomuraea sp. NPDC050556]|uniref:hypothetical protein n=1 Tax=Nonomuraea sp. NPDC050556 TaxID=3364369 RepID=UPI0037910A45
METLHFTLRSLEPYRSVIPAADLLLYGGAARRAVRGMLPVRVRLRGVTLHRGGVLVEGQPVDGALEKLADRFAEELGEAGAFQDWRRDRWYVSLMHFAQPLGDPARLMAWCDERAGMSVGTAVLTGLDIVQAVKTATGVRLDTLVRASDSGDHSSR